MNVIKKILLTGADGFIGKRLYTILQDQGYEVFGHSLKDGDIVTTDLSCYAADYVINLAALASVPDSWEKTADYYRVNVMGTENVLEYCRNRKVGMTILSTYVYGSPQFLPVSENHAVNAMSPYHHSKILCEDLCNFYHHNFDLDITVLRPFNIYGPGQPTNFLISSIIDQYKSSDKDSITVMDTSPRRDYVYVDDVINAITLNIGKKGYNTYNVASGESTSVEELIYLVCEVGGKDKPFSSNNSPRKNEVNNIVADISKIFTEIGWKPEVGLQEGIQRIMENA